MSPHLTLHIWRMRARVADFFGGASAEKEVQDLSPRALLDLYRGILAQGTNGAQPKKATRGRSAR